MALVIQNEAMTPSYVPYERPPQPLTLWTAIPRGLQSFIVDGQSLDVILVGDDALLNLQATLPPNFGYVMQDMNVTLIQAGGQAWAAKINLNLQNFYRTTENLSVALNGNWVQNMDASALDDSTRSLSLEQPWPSFPMIGTPGTSGIQVNISTFNDAQVARAAGTIHAYIAFWQFDLEQIRKFPINSPYPIQAR